MTCDPIAACTDDWLFTESDGTAYASLFACDWIMIIDIPSGCSLVNAMVILLFTSTAPRYKHLLAPAIHRYWQLFLNPT